MDFKKIILFFITIIFIFTSCDRQYDLEVNGNKLTENIEFSCGKIQITAYCISRSMFIIEQNYDLKEQSFFYRDSLQIEYKGSIIPFDFYDKYDKINTSIIEIINGEEYEIHFSINEPLVNDGDTITVKDFGYFYCNNKKLDIGTIYLVIRL